MPTTTKHEQLKPQIHNTKKKQNSTFTFLCSIIKPHARTMLWGLICLITVDILLLSVPYIFSQIIDAIIQEADTLESFSLHTRSILYTSGLLAMSLIIFILRISWRRLLIIPSFKIENTLKKQLFKHFLQFSQKSQEKMSAGTQVSLVERETQQLTQAISWGTLALADGLFTVMSVYIILIVSYQEIAWASLLVYPLAFIYIYFMFKKLGKQYEKIQEKIASISELTRAMFENIATIKSHNSELFYQKKFLERGKEIVKIQVHISFINSLMWPMTILMNGIALVLTLYFGIKQYTLGLASIGDIVAVIYYIAQVEIPFLGLGFAFDIQQKGLSNIRRIKRSFAISPNVYKHDLLQQDNASKHLDIQGTLDIQNLLFHYKKETLTNTTASKSKQIQFALGPINLHCEAGTWLGITGRIGSGKSTLAKLISRIYEIQQSDAIQWDTTPIQEIALSIFRKQVLYQAQNFHLFSLSVAQNIVFNENTLNSQEKKDAITYGNYSALESDVTIFPLAWDTQIGKDGILLSGGQKQRVSLARSLYAQIPVLILDDIFSGLDNKISKQVLKNLIDLRRNKTTIIISHNLPIISNTDTIIVMDEGKIIEEGTHARLLEKQSSVYAKSWKEYLIDQGEYYE